MTPEPDHIFWAKRWKAAHDIETRRWPPFFFQLVPTLAMLNYATYLIEVFSFMFERKKCCDSCDDIDQGRV